MSAPGEGANRPGAAQRRSARGPRAPSTRICRSRRTRASSAACSATCCARRPATRASRASRRSARRRSAFAAPTGDERRARATSSPALLNPLPIAAVLDVVRAFSYFSHLANIAEDVHQNRRRRAHALAGSPPQRGSIARRARAHCRRRAWTAPRCSAGSPRRWCSPVLTAHPTEVQRKSILDCEREIARLLTWRDRTALTPEEAADFAARLHRQVLALWQTAMLRLSQLQVNDEIDNGLAYYRYTFLERDSDAVRGARGGVAARFGIDARARAAVPADRLVDRRRSRRQSVRDRRHARRTRSARRRRVAFEHYLDEVHRLGAELSLSTRLVTPTAGAAGARRRRARHQSASPGRAVSAGARRHLRAARRDRARAVRATRRARAARADAAPYATPRRRFAPIST